MVGCEIAPTCFNYLVLLIPSHIVAKTAEKCVLVHSITFLFYISNKLI